jgi:hypothetical protein
MVTFLPRSVQVRHLGSGAIIRNRTAELILVTRTAKEEFERPADVIFFGQHGGLNQKNTTKIGHFRMNEHNHFLLDMLPAKFKRLPHIFDHPWLVYSTDDMVRGRSTLIVSASGLCRRHLVFPMSADVGPCRQWHIWVGHGRKYGARRWNRVAISFRSKVISTSGLCCLHFALTMSADVWPCLECHGWVGHHQTHWRIAAGIVMIKSYFFFRFGGRHFEHWKSVDVGQCPSVIIESDMIEVMGFLTFQLSRYHLLFSFWHQGM